MKTILPLSDRFRILSYFPGNFRRYFTGKPSCPTGTLILPIFHPAPKAQLGPSPLQSNKYSNHPSPHPRRPEGQNPSRPQSATPRSSSPRLLETSTLRLRRQPAAYLGLGQAPRLPPAFRLQQIGIDGAYDNTTPRTNDGGIAAVATINPPPIDGTTPAADIRGSNNPADSRISSSTVQ